ncbi:hypothetical protein HNP55_001254 [Paucibacter oligotrophus]|uniref:Uncharacterized protein n=1 Tax=Roseateles oligotrophus TaxID=1769250 RepID=A0A840L9D3_9BURK|nr:hypothetical protein [Roseateles oligotrophus]
MPYRQDNKLTVLDAVEDVVANTPQMQAANPFNPGIGDFRANAGLPQQQMERYAKIINKCVRCGQAIRQPPPIGSLNLRRRSEGDAKLERHG